MTPNRQRLIQALRAAAEELEAVHTARCEYMIEGGPQVKADAEVILEMLTRYRGGR